MNAHPECAHAYRFAGRAEPIDRCDRPTRLICLLCGLVLVTRCSASSRAKCAPCGATYRGRVRRVFASGWTDRPTDRLYFLTLSAPSEHGPHAMPSGDVCPCTPEGGIHLAEWNATAGRRWNDFITDLRRDLGPAEYCKSAETQDRGALHFHALIRTDQVLNLRWVRQLAMHHGFGHEVTCDLLDGEQHSKRASGYCAKYASKSADDRELVPWLDRRTGELIVGAPRLRVWTASRRWGATMAQIKATQAAWARREAEAAAEAPASPAAAPADPTEAGPGLDDRPASATDTGASYGRL